MKTHELHQMLTQLNSVFTPAAPIEKRDFFAGRVDQIQLVLEAAAEFGRHAVIYGERGVGKTSLANIINELLPERFVIKVSADTLDGYNSLWRKTFKRMELSYKQRKAGFVASDEVVHFLISDVLPADAALVPDDVISIFERQDRPIILIIDEFDRVIDEPTKTIMADTIKAFSDTVSRVTLVIVGVAQTVNDLIGEHPSIERNIRQTKLPRMSTEELEEIIDKGLNILGMQIEDNVKVRITGLWQGFPHYTHLLAKYSARQAIEHERRSIVEPDFDVAIEQAVEDTHESIRTAYYKATIATRKETLFPKILLAAAMAREDDFGTFRATGILAPLRSITGKDDYIVPHFAYHLGKLCSDERGNILEKLGAPKRHRYRFSNPLMKPYILMKGYSEGIITETLLNAG